MVLTRGERNNNPGNIREDPSDKTIWLGERATDDDKAFEEFKTPGDGIRALAVVLLSYYKHHHLDTIEKIITRWAPGNENNTAAYIAAVAASMNKGATDTLAVWDFNTLTALVKAIIIHENGRCIYIQAEINKAVLRAL